MAVKVALLGFGIVGKGTYKALEYNKEIIKQKTGLDIEVVKILEKNPQAIECGIAPVELFTQDADEILEDPEIKIVAEILGGFEPATSFIMKALESGKSVVTPNKAVVAKNYKVLHETAAAHDAFIKYEASVGGTIPVIGALNKQLIANTFTKIEGIVNGTTNYILTKMEEEGLSYEAALAQAQALGFAEKDPTADVEGIDAQNKICILAAEAFGIYVDPEEIPRKGITEITIEDIKNAAKKNCKIKLIASAHNENGNFSIGVRPELVPNTHPLAQIRNEFNGIMVSCSMSDDIFLSGRGAGMDPTGSAVAGDIIEIAKIIEGKYNI